MSGLIPLSFQTLLMFFIGSIFQNMEAPAYDSLVADLTDSSERERAYSLSYLSMNVGMVLSPILGGILFQNHLGLAFIISGCSILTSTCLIFFFVKDIKKDTTIETQNVYEAHHEGNVIEVLKTMPLLLLFFLITSIGSVIYAQFNFLVPLHLEHVFNETGALYFGMLSSINAFVVIIFTPLFTKLFTHWHDINRLILGAFFQMVSLGFYIFITDQLWLSVISVIGFTFGEILTTLSNNPYLTKRIPASHRGRILSISNNIVFVIGSMANLGIGQMADALELSTVWIFITFLGVFQCLLFFIYRHFDRQKFALLYALDH